ncbi:hypothetical protein PMI42_07434, partial [Bradyrhizobium sp. YR681]|uniref:hypothetical protein n=1 Tax=Bradyrhizobium sp. YR681 TaxID=1144344 RepID=UPI00026F8F28
HNSGLWAVGCTLGSECMMNRPEESRDTVFASDRHPQVAYFAYFFIGLLVSGAWTLIGVAVAYARGEFRPFIAEWESLQAPYLIGLGTCLVLIARSGFLETYAKKVARNQSTISSEVVPLGLRLTLVGAISFVGTASLVWMGFKASGPLLGFMWFTAASICIAAGVITLHTIDLLLLIHRLRTTGIKTFRYSPARTPELRDLINYFTSFTLILSVAYSFAFAGTIKGNWTGDRAYIELVQTFWPLIYVPICSAALIYPHFAIHGLIREAKEVSLAFYQRDIDKLMIDYKRLDSDDVAKINSLAQLFDRISATPDYVVDIGIAVRTCLPLAFNVATLFAKSALSHA